MTPTNPDRERRAAAMVEKARRISIQALARLVEVSVGSARAQMVGCEEDQDSGLW